MSSQLERDPVEALRERLARYTADHHPLQHATAQFHLGNVLLEREELREAEEAFTVAAGLFGLRGAKAEQAKALNGLGATLRAAGRHELAARALGHAAAGLAAAGLPLEEGAARFNLGLVLRESGAHEAAAAQLAIAAERFDPETVPAQAAAAAREHGATRLELGDAVAAEDAFRRAVELADRAGDQAGRAAAANALGLAQLAAGRAGEARESLEIAVAASPRSLRPGVFAMAKANLALAHEHAGEPARARLAARQALAAPGAPEPVRAQARDILDRLGRDTTDLATVFDAEPPQGQERLAREELLRAADADREERVADMREWIAAHLESQLEPTDVAERWLGALLELPPEALERLARSTMEALATFDAEAADTFRNAVGRAMARFHIPQWMRLQDVFAQAAEEMGDSGSWR